MKVRHESRKARARKQALLKAGVWTLLGLFVASVAGVAIVLVAH